jgi:hypothetical protein
MKLSHGLIILLLAVAVSCRTPKKIPGGDTRTKAVEMLDESTYKLTRFASDKTYAYTPENAVKVGGASTSSGPLNERRYLNALQSPDGKPVKYKRTGSCCPFLTPNAMIGDKGLLDRYLVYWEGGSDTLSIYINMYDEGDLFIPVGLKSRLR